MATTEAFDVTRVRVKCTCPDQRNCKWQYFYRGERDDNRQPLQPTSLADLCEKLNTLHAQESPGCKYTLHAAPENDLEIDYY